MPRILNSALVLSLLAATDTCLRAENLSPVAEPPNWGILASLQETVTRAEFVRLLDNVYAPGGAARGVIEVVDDRVMVVRSLGTADRVSLRLARTPEERKKPARYWRRAAELARPPTDQPLKGLRIALDPGHIGGEWARMEARWFQIGTSNPVMEGTLTLLTAEHLARKLGALGAEVLRVRRETTPVTEKRPSDFFPLARTILAAQGVAQPRPAYLAFEEPKRGDTVQFQAELLFYRMSEIRKRAAIVNTELRPDLTICLHFNAESWGSDAAPQLAAGNHFHVLVNGCYSATELRLDDQRLDLLLRLSGGITEEEHRIATQVARVFARRTALPPFVYHGESARRIGSSPYVWARNLLANRLYQCPVVYLEPYVMNSRETWERVQAGDYEGQQYIAGSMRPSICREYADAVAEGITAAMR